LELTLEPGSTRPIKLVIADDHAVVRRGLRQILDNEAGFEVLAEAENVEGARRYTRGHHPDVLVLDLNMPGAKTLDETAAILAEAPGTRIVVLTMQSEPEYARQALSAGRPRIRAQGSGRVRARRSDPARGGG
jgi:two-component system response regulator NreC